MSVGTLLAMPAARGLFHKAIPQSGACHTGAPVERANRAAERVLSKLRVQPSDAAAIRALTPAQLLTGTLLDDGRTPDPELGMAYQPVVDGTHVPRAAIEMVADGSASGVAVMVGSTLEEWKLFSLMDPSLHKLDRAGLGARISRRLTAPAADALVDNYEKARAQRGESVTPGDLFTAIETDRIFRIPGVRLAQVQRRHDSRVYSYLFTWPSPAMGGVLGSCHALELGFVFGTNQIPGMTRIRRHRPGRGKARNPDAGCVDRVRTIGRSELRKRRPVESVRRGAPTDDGLRREHQARTCAARRRAPRLGRDPRSHLRLALEVE